MHQKNIYVIRHGETDYNRKGVVQGSGIDADLNDMGRAQAAAFFDAYQHISFDKLYVSALKRTHQSVQLFMEAGIPYEVLSGLNEISWGSMEGRVPSSLDDDYYSRLIGAWSEGRTDVPTAQGESPDQVAARQRIAFDTILANANETTILIAMHGRAIRILLCWLTGQPLSEMDTFEHSNLCLYRLVYDYQTKQFTIALHNDTAHLLTLSIS